MPHATLGFLAGGAGMLACLSLLIWHSGQSVAGPLEGWSGLVLGLSLTAATLGILVRMRSLARVELAEVSELTAAGETLRAVLGATGQGIILADQNLRVRLFNPAAEIIFGRMSDETLSMPVRALIPGLATVADTQPLPGEDTAGPRVRHLAGRRGAGDEFPLRLSLRNLMLGEASWLLILAEDLNESERLEARLDYLEQHDTLTGLYNRQTLERVINATAAEPEAVAEPHVLCLIDLDHFKLINGACGHTGGDELLRQLGRILSIKLASASALARLSADEFAALFVGAAVSGAESACEELIRTVRSFPFTWRERSYDVTVSVGLMQFEPTDGAPLALGRADIACQMAKAQGGNRLYSYSPEDAGSIRRLGDVTLVSTIGRALDEDRFRVMAQPIQPLQAAGAPLHYEILVRMQDVQGQLVTPDHFIPAAERYVLMPAVDRWIIAHVLECQADRLRAWEERFPDRFLFAVNLSATTLMDDAFLPYLKRQFADHRVPYSAICFEVTETNAVSDLGRARTFMQSLCDLGSSFAVDDFGTGFASYTYVKSLPVRYLKIDGSFVRNLAKDPVDKAFVESINHVGHVLGLQTIAEWAETPEVVETLRDMGVDFAQGYGVGEAVALEDLGLQPSLETAGGAKRLDSQHTDA
jgi:diguanylate cyclase (GGDEF)-like protein/PAS domain S-box-containing protein